MEKVKADPFAAEKADLAEAFFQMLPRGCLTHDHPDRESFALRVATLLHESTVVNLEFLNFVNR